MDAFKGISKTVPAESLHDHTQKGWIVLDAFDQDETDVVYDTEARRLQDPSGCYHPDTVQVQRTLVLRRRHFLVGLSENSVVAQVTSERDEAQTKRREAEKALEDIRIVNQKVEANAARLLDNEQRMSAEVKRLRAGLDEEKSRVRRMEDDLGKVRAAIGDLKMREILGEGTAAR